MSLRGDLTQDLSLVEQSVFETHAKGGVALRGEFALHALYLSLKIVIGKKARDSKPVKKINSEIDGKQIFL